jgi:hypothetical protein
MRRVAPDRSARGPATGSSQRPGGIGAGSLHDHHPKRGTSVFRADRRHHVLPLTTGMTRIALATIALAASTVAEPASAESPMSGNELLAYCTSSPGGSQVGVCYAYIQGIADITGWEGKRGFFEVCIPPSVTTKQIVDTVVGSLRTYVPAARESHLPHFLVATALGANFPCSKK